MENYFRLGDIAFSFETFYDLSLTIANNLLKQGIKICSSKYGGPIAITNDNSRDENILSTSIYIIWNNGSVLNKISKKELIPDITPKPNIVAIQFLNDENLIIFFKELHYVILNPFTCKIIQTTSLKDNSSHEILEGAKITEKYLVFCTNKKGICTFHFIRDVYSPFKESFYHEPIAIFHYPVGVMMYFMPMHPQYSLSKTLECYVNHPKAGIIRLIQNQKEKIDFGEDLEKYTKENKSQMIIKEIKTMSLSSFYNSESTIEPQQLLAILTNNSKIYIFSQYFPLETTIELDYDGPIFENLEIFWISQNSILIKGGNYYEIITTSNIKRSRKKLIHCFQESDGLRILLDKQCQVLRELNSETKKLYLINESNPSKDLYEFAKDQEDFHISPYNKILQNKEDLYNAVQGCLEVACYTIDSIEQKIIFKAIALGRCWLLGDTKIQEKIPEICKNLRVINTLRQDRYGRAITYAEFLELLENKVKLLNLLIKYHNFYVAIEIAKYLEFNEDLRSYLYKEWAFVKLENNEEDSQLSLSIYEKFRNEPNFSFIEIAHRAAELGKKSLALTLMNYENSLKKKVIAMASLNECESALKAALSTHDLNLVSLIILKLLRQKSIQENLIKAIMESKQLKRLFYNILHSFFYDNQNLPVYPNPELKSLLYVKINEINHQSNIKNIDLMEVYATNTERILYAIWRSYNEKKKIMSLDNQIGQQLSLQDKFILIKGTINDIKETKNIEDDYQPHLIDQIKQYSKYLDHIITEESLTSEIPLLSLYIKLYTTDDYDGKNKITAEKIKKKFKLSNRSTTIALIKYYCEDRNNWIVSRKQYIKNIIDDKNRNIKEIPYIDLVGLLSDYHEFLDLAENYALKIDDIDDKIIILKSIGTMNSLAAALECAMKTKRLSLTISIESLMLKNKYRESEKYKVIHC